MPPAAQLLNAECAAGQVRYWFAVGSLLGAHPRLTSDLTSDLASDSASDASDLGQ